MIATAPPTEPDFGARLFDLGKALTLAAAESRGPLPSHELTVSLVCAGSGALEVTTDDSAVIASLVDQIDMKPHLFAERYLRLERAAREIDDRLDSLERRLNDLSYRVPV